jgi:N-acetylneuraminate synthase/N,N'-diacetyllegionaminate synthase
VALRPGDGISPMEIEKVMGKNLNRELPEFHKLSWEDLS